MITCSLIDRYTREDGKDIRLFENKIMIIEDPSNDLYICDNVEMDIGVEMLDRNLKTYTRELIDDVADQVIEDIGESMLPFRTHDSFGDISIYDNNILHYYSEELGIDAIIGIDYEWFIEGIDYDLSDAYLEDLIARIRFMCSR